MNAQTAAATPAFAVSDWLTTANLVVTGLFAVLVLVGIVYGMRLKAARRAAEHAEAERIEEARPPAPAGDSPAAEPVSDARADAAIAADAEAQGAPAGPGDGPVTQLKGLGPKVAARLAELGITRVGQLAALDEDAAAALDARLGAFSGRMARDRWPEQARLLAAGDVAAYEAAFGKLS
jgi:predicted flap endonuclease-1-like 5' DNA nuclease